MSASRHLARLLIPALCIASSLLAATFATAASAESGDDAALASVHATLAQEGLLADPFALSCARTAIGAINIMHGLRSGEPQVHMAWDSREGERWRIATLSAVTAPGDSVRVFVSGVDKDAVVTVFANGHSFAARSDGASHFEIAVKLEGQTRLQSIGVTVFSRASVYDPSAPPDSRTWILPILVGAPPAAAEQYFGS